MRTWTTVAVLAKPKNLQGGLVARAVPGLPFLLREGMPVAFVPPVIDMPRTGTIETVEPLGKDAYYVEFDTIDTIDAAEALAGSSCLVRLADLPPDYDKADTDTIVGYRVNDEIEGYLGSVIEVVENKAQNLIVVSKDDDEILIPFVDAFVVSIDDDERVIATRIPCGLLDC